MYLEQPLGLWSFSRVETFDRCPYKLYLQKTKAPLLPPDPDAPNVRGTAIHKGIEDFIVNETAVLEEIGPNVLHHIRGLRQAFPHGRVNIEEDWVFDIHWARIDKFSNDRWVWIKVDACHRTDDTLTLYDWKTGKSEGNEIKHRAQGQLYAIAAWKLFPEYQRYEVIFAYTDEDRLKTCSFTPQQLIRAQNNWELRGHKVASATHLPPNPLPHNCRYCDYGMVNGSGACEFAAE